MLPNERISQLPPMPISKFKIRNDQFYSSQQKMQRKQTKQKRMYDHTKASQSGMWKNRLSEGKELNDLLMCKYSKANAVPQNVVW